MDIKVGDFVLMHAEGMKVNLWVEVLGIIKSESNDPQYLVQYWANGSNDWNTFYLAPETAHRGMVKEVRRLEPVVADIFRQTLK